MKKRRSDRNHIIYKITNTSNEDFYIGLTVLRGSAYLRSAKLRLAQHISRATTQDFDWALCNSIREYGSESFKVSILEVIRGKQSAHTRETELIKNMQPTLNTVSIYKS
jgi:hypothetical protein